MGLLQNIRLRLYRYFLEQKQPKEVKNRGVVNLDEAKSIGILYDANNEQNLKLAANYAKALVDRGKTITTLAYKKSTKKNETLSYNHFTNKQVSWLFIPKSKEVNDFMDQSFDVLINLYVNNNLPLEYISTRSKARYKVGSYIANRTHCYDLMVDIQQRKELKYLIEQIDYLLNKINKNAQAV